MWLFGGFVIKLVYYCDAILYVSVGHREFGARVGVHEDIVLVCTSAANGLEKLHLPTVFHVVSAGHWE